MLDTRRLSSLLEPAAQPVVAAAAAPAAPATPAHADGSVTLVSSLHPEVAAHTSTSAGTAAELRVLGEPVGPGVRYGADSLESRALYVESRIVSFERELEECLGMRPHPTGVASQDSETLWVGRICCDSGEERW